MRYITRLLALSMLALSTAVYSQSSVTERTYRNPILNADVPDMSVCRVGEYFYMVSTTMHRMPGCPVMRSADMMHWEVISYVFPRIDDGPRYDLIDGATAYGKGQWASSIRYHEGKFYVWFTANGAPGRGFIYTATDPAGPWTLLSRPRHMHDGSLLFDDDGRVYMFCDTGHLIELESDLSDQKVGGIDQIIFERDADEQALLEGSSVIKHDGRYYLLMISMDWSIPGRLRREVCYRADQITGPYEKRVILETPFEEFGGCGQGCIVDGPDGQWWALIFQDRGGIGRTPCLMPCTWRDGWPMLGDAEGRVPNDTTKYHMDMSGLVGSDDFTSPQLKLYWQWNHNPVDSAWSLTERPGCMRLHTPRVVPNLYVAPNTLTQRMTAPACTGSVHLWLDGLREGDRTGLWAYQGDGATLTVERREGQLYLIMDTQQSHFAEPQHAIADVSVQEYFRLPLAQNEIYLRLEGDFAHGRDVVSFVYSLDGEVWTHVGPEVHVAFDYRRFFMGTKFGIFCYATQALGGYVDVDWFRYDPFIR